MTVQARLAVLRVLDAALVAHEGALMAALAEDLGKSEFDAYVSEVLTVRQEVRHAIRHLPRWAAPRRVATGWFHWPARAAVAFEPLGRVLILSPWNYPVQLSLSPLVAALAAGNRVVLKPSEHAPATAGALAAMLAGIPGVEVMQGDAALAAELVARPWDHIFFTGSTGIGRGVAEAAARNLTPCTLELGGANPCVVDATADIDVVAKRIAWAKFLNAGQTCIAPNHVLVEESRFEPLVAALKRYIAEFYGADGQGMQRIAFRRHYERLLPWLGCGRLLHGGGADAAGLHIQPTLTANEAAPAEEIFGPILPIVPWRDRAALLEGLQAAPAPLAVYAHSRDPGLLAALRESTRSGAFVENDHIVQAAVAELPFGGVGASGWGRSHGRAGFEGFSNPRAHYRKSPRLDLPLRYPPHESKLAWVKRLLG
ncbi:aldehyde dehydrogenase family protein [Rhodovarius crocodyli]|uniref:Aldehyde dehydrogenase n=1 Tax=Rhodovarius crocodyli TaxID=1979269 RepID=A0A437LYX0_9PROT|nr:aldehyde dehydrogenase family protein [Rhodovarius crocodyli]RVT90618.1 aldehyde dehydrogenase family protein [Rhodovarius crocodyli]